MDCAVRILEKGEFSPGYDAKICEYCKIKSICRKGEFRAGMIDDSDSDD